MAVHRPPDKSDSFDKDGTGTFTVYYMPGGKAAINHGSMINLTAMVDYSDPSAIDEKDAKASSTLNFEGVGSPVRAYAIPHSTNGTGDKGNVRVRCEQPVAPATDCRVFVECWDDMGMRGFGEAPMVAGDSLTKWTQRRHRERHGPRAFQPPLLPRPLKGHGDCAAAHPRRQLRHAGEQHLRRRRCNRNPPDLTVPIPVNPVLRQARLRKEPGFFSPPCTQKSVIFLRYDGKKSGFFVFSNPPQWDLAVIDKTEARDGSWPQASTTVEVLMDEGTETEEMDNQELLQLLRADLSAAEARSDRRFEEVKQEIKEVRQEVKEVRQEVKEVRQDVKQEVAASEQRILAQVNQRIDDLRDYIEANRLIKNNWRAFAVAALATAAVVGTFLLQLMEALN